MIKYNFLTKKKKLLFKICKIEKHVIRRLEHLRNIFLASRKKKIQKFKETMKKPAP